MSKKTKGWLDSYEDERKSSKPYVAKDKADFDYRTQMYNDSLHNYMRGRTEYDNFSAEKKDYDSLPSTKGWDNYSPHRGDTGKAGYVEDMYIDESKNEYLGDHMFDIYRRPTQKVYPPLKDFPNTPIDGTQKFTRQITTIPKEPVMAKAELSEEPRPMFIGPSGKKITWKQLKEANPVTSEEDLRKIYNVPKKANGGWLDNL